MRTPEERREFLYTTFLWRLFDAYFEQLPHLQYIGGYVDMIVRKPGGRARVR